MRRFVDTIAGRAFCHLAAVALALPTVTLMTVSTRAEAQVQQLPAWAVTEFRDIKAGNTKYGKAAADAVTTELAKTNRYDVVPQDTVNRAIETLGLTSPLDGSVVNLSRVGTEAFGQNQNLRGATIVAGEVVDYRVDNVGGGKQAKVAIRAVAYDVSSALPVNGALQLGESTIRGGNVTDEALIQDAIVQAAALVVRTMQGQQLPSATILNTGTRTALLNQGTRSGFKTGDSVIITRGSQQVATGRIGSIEPDQAEISIERFIIGVAPGDRVRASFTPPLLPAAGGGFINSRGTIPSGNSRPRRNSNNATLISALLVVGLVGVLLGGGNGSSTSPGRVTAEATLDPTNNTSPAVRIHWERNGFIKGNANTGNGLVAWQVYRSTVSLNPVLVVRDQSEVLDSSLQNYSSQLSYLNDPIAGGTTCKNTGPTNATFAAPALITPGTSYQYQVEAVYAVTGLDLPSGNTAGGGGTGTVAGGTGTVAGGTGTVAGGTGTVAGGTGTVAGGTGTTATTSTTGTTATTGTTGTTSTAGNTGNTGGGSGDQLCYFRTGRATSGRVTPINRPVVSSPSNNQVLTSTTPFTVGAVQTGNGAFTAQYILEFSDVDGFPKNRTVRTRPQTGTGAVTFSINPLNSDLFPSRIRNAPIVYFRVGARSQGDKPGPVKDTASGQRYIYSLTGQYRNQVTNPNPPTG